MKAIILLSLLLAPVAVMAQSEVCASSATMNVVTVASHTATNVDSSAVKMAERKFIEVVNASTVTVTCGFQSGLTSGQGKLLSASGGSWSLNLSDVGYSVVVSTYSPYRTQSNYSMGLWCVGSGDNITSKVALIQCR